MHELSRGARITSWIAQLTAAAILLQTLFFKFTAAPESIYIFTQLGVEPWGRLLTATLELVAGILLLVPATAAVGALLSLGLMSGAILSHLSVLGIEVQEDGGTLFILAFVVFAAAALVAWLRRHQIPGLGSRLSP